ncbi:MAG: ATP-binding cassette domain-containing protein [Spirochaetaceae bacterium]|nr:ATP-binding cassette domain-containing protein [Spirochaetaceae bacterium]
MAVRKTRIGVFLHSNRAALCYTVLFGILLLFPMIMSPIFKRVFTDSILINNITEWLPVLLLLMTGVAIFSAVVVWLQKNCLLRLANKIELSGTTAYMWRLFNAPPDMFFQKDNFALISGAGVSANISRILTSDMISLFSALVSVIFYYYMMIRLDISMSLIVLALAIVSLLMKKAQSALAGFFYQPSQEPCSLRDLTLRDEWISSQGLRNIETFKATASETHFFQQMMSSKIRIINAKGKDDEANASAPFDNLPEIFFLNILLLVSALRIMNREFSIGSYLAFQAYAAAFFYPMGRVFAAPGLFAKLENRLRDLYREQEAGAAVTVPPPAVSASAPVRTSGKLRGYIEFKDVSFSYPGNLPVLEHFSLSLRPGQRAALVGKSGCGKSAVVKLLQGLYTPTAGEIAIDGISPECIDRETFINSIGFANQKISFFTASVRDNITLWDENVSAAAVYQAVNAVGMHDFIASLDGAYDYMLTENARILSGGQQQKMEIARALLYNPSIVILDNVNGAVDPWTAAALEQGLVERGCTVIQATNLLSYVTGYDEIILLDQGRVAERGTHLELLEKSHWYATLFREGEAL